MASLIKTCGNIETVEPKNGKDFSLKECYNLIGTDIIQVLATNDGRLMIIDEEGKLKNDAKRNRAADTLVKGLIADDDFIVGNALVCKNEEFR